MFNTLTMAVLACGMTTVSVQSTPPYEVNEKMPLIENVYNFEKLSYEEYQCGVQAYQDWEQEQIRLEQKRQEELRRQAEIEAERTRVASITRTYYTSSDITKSSYLNATELEKVFKGTGLQGLGAYFIQVEEEYGVNAVFLSSIAVLESGWGNSNFAKTRNNLFGFQANDDNPNKATSFASKYDAIVHVAKHLSKNYLNPSGPYYNGKSPSGVNVMYCTSSDWSSKVVKIMNNIVSKATS